MAGMTRPTAEPDLFNGRQVDREIIVLCVRWYLSFKLSSRNLGERMGERENRSAICHDRLRKERR